MIQKIIQVGSSAAVVLPKIVREELKLRVGEHVQLEISKNKKGLLIQRVRPKISASDARIAKLTVSFIGRYRKDLEQLAKH